MKKIILIFLSIFTTMFFTSDNFEKKETFHDSFGVRRKLDTLRKIRILDKSLKEKQSKIGEIVAINDSNFWIKFKDYLQENGKEKIPFFSDEEFEKETIDRIEFAHKIDTFATGGSLKEAELKSTDLETFTKWLTYLISFNLMVIDHFDEMRSNFPRLFDLNSSFVRIFREIHLNPLGHNIPKMLKCNKNYFQLHERSEDCDGFDHEPLKKDLDSVFLQMGNKELFRSMKTSATEAVRIVREMTGDLSIDEKKLMIVKLNAINDLSKTCDHEIGIVHELEEQKNFLGSQFYEDAMNSSNTEEIISSERYIEIDRYLLEALKDVELLRMQGKNVLINASDLSDEEDYEITLEFTLSHLIEAITEQIEYVTTEFKSEL